LALRQHAASAAEWNRDSEQLSRTVEEVKAYRDIYASANEKARQMAGCDERFRIVERSVVGNVLRKYEDAVERGDLEALSLLTPLLGTLQLAERGVGLYLRYSRSALVDDLDKDNVDDSEKNVGDDTDVIMQELANVFNEGVMYLRRHLPMVAYALGEADGDVGLLQLVHAEVEKRAIRILKEFEENKELVDLCKRGEDASQEMENFAEEIFTREDLIGKSDNIETYNPIDEILGNGMTQADLDLLLDESALLLQYTESYERFLRHAAGEVERTRQQRRNNIHNNVQDTKEDDIEVLVRVTRLNEVVSELGDHYSGLERTFMFASMQRAFLNGLSMNERYYTELPSSISSDRTSDVGSKGLQTSLVEEIFYAGKKSTRRVFATGQTGLACAAVNFIVDSLERLLRDALVRRADVCASALKPGNGLIVGQGGLGQSALAAFTNAQKGFAAVTTGSKESETPEEMRKRIQDTIARACASFNDIEVSVGYTKQLESQFMREVEESFPEGLLLEQLRTCIKSLSTVADTLNNALKRSTENLSNQILPRIRTIVNDSVGQESTGTAAVSGVKVGVGISSNVSAVKMNYDLDEEAYELSQAGDGYLSKMLAAFDEILDPLRLHLSPGVSDYLLLNVIGGASKRIEAAIKRCRFTYLGSLSLDADIREFVGYTKARLASPSFSSTKGLYAVCLPLARLSQISMLMTVTDLDDVTDIMRRAKGQWHLKADDSKTFLTLRVDFEAKKVSELLRLDND